MAESLMFPEIDAAALKPASAPTSPAALAVIPPANIDLAKLDLEAVALAQFDASLTAITTATKTLTGVVHDLSTAGKLADAKSLRQRLINAPLADARKVETALKSKLTAVSKAVGAKLVIIEADFKTAAGLITPQIEAREAELATEEKRRADEAQAKAEAAAMRAEQFEAALARIRGQGTAAKGLPSQRIAEGIAGVEALAFGPEWEEYAPQAAQAQAETLVVLRLLFADTQAAEQTAAAAEAMRLESERLAAEARVLRTRMGGIQFINSLVSMTQATIIGLALDELVATISDVIDDLQALPVGEDVYGDLASTADAAKTHALRQLGAMLVEARDRKAKQEAADLAAQHAEAEKVDAGALSLTIKVDEPDSFSEQPMHDWPDLQTAEIAAMPLAISKIEVFEPTPEQRAERWSPRVEVTFAAVESTPIEFEIPAGTFIDGNHSHDNIGTATRIDVVAEEPVDPLPGLLAHIEKAFDCKFPTQPKPGVEWWAELRRLAGEVRA